MPSSPGIGMHVEVKDPDDKIVLSRVISNITQLSDIQKYFTHIFLIKNRFTVRKEDSRSHHTPPANTSFACTRTAQNGSQAPNWYFTPTRTY